MDEENKDLEEQDSKDTANEDGDSQDTTQDSEPDEKDKIIADLEDKNKQLFARIQKGKDKPEKVEEDEKPPVPETDVDKLVSEKFEERDLASLDLSDELKTEVKAYAQAKDITILEASKSEYVGFLKTTEEEQEQEEDASVSTRGGGATAKRDFSKLADEDISSLDDDDFGKYKEWLKTQE